MEDARTPVNPAGTGQVSIYDIARAAGVNPSTVSRALNNRDRIGEATRNRILAIATELGYQPSAIARSLVTSRTYTIGVVAPYLSDPAIGVMIDGIEITAEKHGYRVFVSTARNDPERELLIATNFQRYRVDAVIIVTTHLRSTYQVFKTTLSVPVVLMGQQDPDPDIAVVTMDDGLAISRMIAYLIRQGHRKFAYVGVSDRRFSNAERRDACIDSVRAVYPQEPVHVETRTERTDLLRGAASLSAIRTCGATVAQCYNDMVAIGLIGAAEKAGIRVPQDLSVVGFDDLEIAAAISPALTTIRQPHREIGKRAVEAVLELLAGSRVETVLLQGELVLRESARSPSSK
jgi:DNA-binding LacI/PurR family transcriptional regulator